MVACTVLDVELSFYITVYGLDFAGRGGGGGVGGEGGVRRLAQSRIKCGHFLAHFSIDQDEIDFDVEAYETEHLSIKSEIFF